MVVDDVPRFQCSRPHRMKELDVRMASTSPAAASRLKVVFHASKSSSSSGRTSCSSTLSRLSLKPLELRLGLMCLEHTLMKLA